MHKLTRSLIAALVLLLATALIAEAGGWAVVTLDTLPDQIVAGRAFSIGFTVRQHGRILRDDLTPIVAFERSDAPGSYTVTAQRSGSPGHYTAEVTLPAAGTWNWRVDIEQFGMATEDMAPLVAAEFVPALLPATAGPVTDAAPLAVGTGGTIVAMVAALFWRRTRARYALLIAAAAVLIGVVGFVATGTSVALPAPIGGTAAGSDQAALGRALFIDKGCVMCHAHPEVKPKFGPVWIGDEPPHLVPGKYSAAFLSQWLKNPAQLKPNTVMPNLQLSDTEIAALSAFLDAK